MSISQEVLNVTRLETHCDKCGVRRQFYLSSLSEKEKEVYSTSVHSCPVCTKPMNNILTDLTDALPFTEGTLQIRNVEYADIGLDGLTINLKKLFEHGFFASVKLILPDGDLFVLPDYFDYSIVVPDHIKKKTVKK